MGAQALPLRREIIRPKLSPVLVVLKNSPGEGNLKVWEDGLESMGEESLFESAFCTRKTGPLASHS